MCHCENSKKVEEDRDNAIIAIDGAIAALVMARVILEQQQKPGHTVLPAPQPVEDIKPQAVPRDVPVAACEHRNCLDIQTMGGTTQLCNDCGEQV